MSGSPQDIKVLLRCLEAFDQVSLAKESNTSRALLRERHPLRQLRISEVLLRCWCLRFVTHMTWTMHLCDHDPITSLTWSTLVFDWLPADFWICKRYCSENRAMTRFENYFGKVLFRIVVASRVQILFVLKKTHSNIYTLRHVCLCCSWVNFLLRTHMNESQNNMNESQTPCVAASRTPYFDQGRRVDDTKVTH